MTCIVIIGAGPAGIMLAMALASTLTPKDNTEVVVLEKSAYFYHTDGTPRAFTDESYVQKLFIPLDNAIPKVASSFTMIVRAVAIKISAEPRGEVTYRTIGEDDQEVLGQDVTLAFDYLVVATGSSYSAPIKPAENSYSRSATEAQLEEVREQIEKAQSILVVGGGSVGCEVAGDIAAKFPHKSVAILSASSTLLAHDNVTTKFRERLRDGLANKLKVKLILGERLVPQQRLVGNIFVKQTLVTDKGTKIESDIQLLCGGFHPVTTLIQDMDASLVDARGFIKVNPQLQLTGDSGECYHNIFVLGDASNNPSPKQGYVAAHQGRFLAGELVAVIRKKQPAFTKPYPKIETEMMSIPLGPDGGVTQLPFFGGIVVGDFLTWLFKSRDYFAGRYWQVLGAGKPPSTAPPPKGCVESAP